MPTTVRTQRSEPPGKESREKRCEFPLADNADGGREQATRERLTAEARALVSRCTTETVLRRAAADWRPSDDGALRKKRPANRLESLA